MQAHISQELEGIMAYLDRINTSMPFSGIPNYSLFECYSHRAGNDVVI